MDQRLARSLLDRDARRLTDERLALLRNISGGSSQTDGPNDVAALDDRQADPGPAVAERENNLFLLECTDSALREVQAALVRLDNGTFGRCETCGRKIPDPRLRAVPATRMCIEHEDRSEADDVSLSSPPRESPNEPGADIDAWTRSEALANLDLIVDDDAADADDDVAIGPEEAALHEVGMQSRGSRRLTDAEIQRIEESIGGEAADEQDLTHRERFEEGTTSEREVDVLEVQYGQMGSQAHHHR